MRLLFVFVFLSSVSFGQKTIKKLNKLSMGDSIAPFKETVNEDLLTFKNVENESFYVDLVLGNPGTNDSKLLEELNNYNPEVLFFYKKKKKFTGIYAYEDNNIRTKISFKNGKLDGVWHDSIFDGEEIFVVKGAYSNGLKQGLWTQKTMIVPFDLIKDWNNEKELREVTLKHYNNASRKELLFDKGQLVNCHIPDDNFKKYLLQNKQINKNEDNEIQVAEARAYKGKIKCDNRNISNLEGIEHFTSLKKLDCSKNKLTHINLSKNIKLEYLICSENQLYYLNLTKNINMKYVDCYTNNLKKIVGLVSSCDVAADNHVSY